ncbi:MAG: class I SAM-dependent methyltransferase [Oscillospiraceae bacterium]|nr:class I SAM-dependent methyltransferase [Oscillospiraceae bacterium]
MSEYNAENFYDKIASKYRWFFSSQDGIMKRANDIKPILEKFNVKTVLDCSCGDGIQAIPLAKMGYSVDAGDISANMLKKAMEFANKENLNINFQQADFRELEKTFTHTYDCVLSLGNSIPHLMTEQDIKKALLSIYNRLNPNGIILVTMRDYDEMLAKKNRFHPMRINDIHDNFRYSILYVFDYFPDIIRFNIIYLIENMETGEKHMEQETVDYNPIKKADFIKYLKETGFVNVDFNGFYIGQK